MEYFYHYTTLENWEKIRESGLQPGRSIMRENGGEGLPNYSYKPAIFGLPSPAPEYWIMSNIESNGKPVCPTLAGLLYSIADWTIRDDLALLKVRLSPADDVRIGDYEVIRKTYNEHEGHDAAFAEYCRSVTKLQDEFNIASKKLPEILCFNAIPADRIEFVKRVPKNYEEIDAYVAGLKKEIEQDPCPRGNSALPKFRG